MTPRALQRWAALATVVGCALGLGYLVWRFELARWPEAACSPVHGVDSGDLLLLDRRADLYRPGDLALVRARGGDLRLVRIAGAAREGRLELEVDRLDCPPGAAPAGAGGLSASAEDLAARVVLVIRG